MGHSSLLRTECLQQFCETHETGLHVIGKGLQFWRTGAPTYEGDRFDTLYRVSASYGSDDVESSHVHLQFLSTGRLAYSFIRFGTVAGLHLVFQAAATLLAGQRFVGPAQGLQQVGAAHPPARVVGLV